MAICSRSSAGRVGSLWSWQVGCGGLEVRCWGAGMHMGHTLRKGHEGVTDEVGMRGVSTSQMSPVHTMRARDLRAGMHRRRVGCVSGGWCMSVGRGMQSGGQRAWEEGGTHGRRVVRMGGGWHA